jgi:hypothetical protein
MCCSWNKGHTVKAIGVKLHWFTDTFEIPAKMREIFKRKMSYGILHKIIGNSLACEGK